MKDTTDILLLHITISSYMYVCVCTVHISCKTQKTKQPSNKSPNNQNKIEKKGDNMSEASHSFFHLNLNPPKDVPLKRCQPHFTGSFHDCPPVLTHLKGQPWDTAVVDVVAKTSWRKNPGHCFRKLWARFRLPS